MIVSPFITSEPLQHISSRLRKRKSPQIKILTDLAVASMIQGSTSPQALVEFCSTVPSTEIRHLPGLHAKVYAADRREAIITSANLTRGGLLTNYEYGVLLSDPSVVGQIVDDLEGYATLGANVSLPKLIQVADIAAQLRNRHLQVLASARREAESTFQELVAEAEDTILQLRASSSRSNNAIFSRTILYLLRRGPLSTTQLHPLVKKIHPDLCDDRIDRVIQGVRFGKRWKHMVRNAQQSLKQQGLINYDGQRWHLAVSATSLESTP